LYLLSSGDECTAPIKTAILEQGIIKMESKVLLKEINRVLAKQFGSRLKSVILYGSEARGTAAIDSDIDIFVLLEGPINLGRDLETAITAAYPLQLQNDRPFHFSICDIKQYEAGEFSLYRISKMEGIAA
jgi:uncharacterized protein